MGQVTQKHTYHIMLRLDNSIFKISDKVLRGKTCQILSYFRIESKSKYKHKL